MKTGGMAGGHEAARVGIGLTGQHLDLRGGYRQKPEKYSGLSRLISRAASRNRSMTIPIRGAVAGSDRPPVLSQVTARDRGKRGKSLRTTMSRFGPALPIFAGRLRGRERQKREFLRTNYALIHKCCILLLDGRRDTVRRVTA